MQISASTPKVGRNELIINCNSTLTVHKQSQTATANAIVPT